MNLVRATIAGRCEGVDVDEAVMVKGEEAACRGGREERKGREEGKGGREEARGKGRAVRESGEGGEIYS